MKEIPLSQGLVALVDADDFDRVMAFKWSTREHRNTFYAQRNVRKPDGRSTTQQLHSFLTGWPLVDHIDGDGLNNRRSNLRPATHIQNLQNQRRRSNNTSGHKGVSWDAPRGKWLARIQVDGARRYLGIFDTAEAAALAYDAAAREYYGEFAALNFPAAGERAA
jgi:hypothetical protein